MSVSADLTHQVLTIASTNQRTYSTTTIKGVIQKGGTNVNGFPLSNYAKFAWTLYTRASSTLYGTLGTIKEGDRITDQKNRTYEVLNVFPIDLLNQTVYYECELLKLQSGTISKFSTRAGSATRDSITGWLSSYTYTSNPISLALSPVKGSYQKYSLGTIQVNYELTAVTSDTIADPNSDDYTFPREGDVLLLPTQENTFDSDAYYEITAVTVYSNLENDSSKAKTHCSFQLKRKGVGFDYLDLPKTSGTWHLDSQGVTTDPRSRIKTWLDTYINVANISYDNPAYPWSQIGNITHPAVLFSGFDYHFLREFDDLGTHALIVVDTVEATPRMEGIDKKPYGFDESVPVTISAVNGKNPIEDKNITATRLVEQIEQEIRRIATLYPISGGYIRQIETVSHKTEQLDAFKLYSTTLNIKYTRPNNAYSNSGITVTYGPSATPTGTYTLANCISLDIQPELYNLRLPITGRVGNILQKLGVPDYTITLKCDLDVQPWSGASNDTSLSWKRPQTNGTKTDVLNEQVFFDIYFNGLTQAYQTLNLGWGGVIKVTLEKPQITRTATEYTATLTFKCYSGTAGTAYKTWFGINP
jgi:hypothetical protein